MEDDLTMDLDLRAYWLIIRYWLWLIILAALLAGGTAYAVSRWMVEPVYRASVSMVVQPSSSLSGSEYSDIMAGQRAAATYAEMLRAQPLQEQALRELGYSEEYLQTRSRPYDLNVQPVRDTQVLEIVVESTDPVLASGFANTLVEVFIDENQERQAARYQTTQERLAGQIAGIEEDIARLKTRLETTSDSAERAQIETQITQLQDSLSRLAAAQQTVQLAELQATDLVSVLEPARVPRSPVRPRPLINALLASLVGAFASVGIVFLREYLDTSVKSTDEAKSLVQAPVLGQIWYEDELARVNGTGSVNIVTQRPLSLTAEAYRLLRANLQFASVDEPLKVLLITSPAPSEGKSTITLNTALALGATGKRIVVIDADMRRPKVCRYAGVDREPGLSDILIDPSADLKSYLKPAQEMQNVLILPPGRLPPNPTEMLGSRRMAEVIEKFKHLDDVVVVIDSPPVLAAADATLLASLADGVLLVLEAGQSDRRMVGQAVEQLQRSGARILGSVLNKVPTNGKGGYYYYYYYYDQDNQGGESFWPWARNQKKRRKREKQPPSA